MIFVFARIRIPDGASKREPECDVQALGREGVAMECEVIGAAIDFILRGTTDSDHITLHNLSSDMIVLRVNGKRRIFI